MAGGGSGADGGTEGQGVGGGVYNFGRFVFDLTTVITGNHASTSNDDGQAETVVRSQEDFSTVGQVNFLAVGHRPGYDVR